MDVKLKAYRLANGYREEFSLPILKDLIIDYRNPAYVLFGDYTNSEIASKDGQYGIMYRSFEGLNKDFKVTKAKVIEIQYRNRRFLVTSWDNGNPVIANIIKMYFYNPIFPIIGNTEEEINVGDLLIEESINIVKQIESEKKYDLRVSRASFSLDESEALTSFLKKYWNPDGYLSAEFMIGVELEGYFWGYSDFDNINFDEIERTYHFDAYDPIKWLQKNIWNQRIPSLGLNTANLPKFLEKTCGLFLSMGKTIIVDVGTSNLYWSRDYVGGYYGEYNPYYYTLDEHLTIMDMMIEILKHYGATMYYDAYGNFNFVTRNKKRVTSYNEDNMREELNKSYQGHEYTGLLINVSNSGTNWSAEQWALVWEQDGELKSLIINADLGNIPKNFSYLDLRQELPDITFEYRVFAPRTKEEIYADYKEILRSSSIYETTLDGIDYNLYDTININGQEYVINYIDIDYSPENTKVRAYKSL